MSEYSELVKNFFLRYEKPEIDEYIVGFSGIDPPLKGNAAGTDHETLDNLLGGDEDGHYHLTFTELDELLRLLGEIPPRSVYDGGFASTTDEEYGLTVRDWLNGGGA